jgi:Glycosyl hydrolase catalytic core
MPKCAYLAGLRAVEGDTRCRTNKVRNVVKIIVSSIFVLNLAASPHAEESGFVWGANGHPFTAYPGVEFEQQLDFLRDLGLTSYRVNVSRIEDIPGLIELNKKAKARNIEVLPILTPGLDLEKEEPVRLQKEAYAFAHTIVSRLKGDVRVWELSNELENYAIIKACEKREDGSQYNCSWGPAGGVGELDYYPPRWNKVSAVLRGLSEGTKDADPSAQRAMGTAGWGHTGAFKRLQKDGVNWDISVWHMYGQDPEWAFKILAQFGKPIWVTEFNHPSGSSKDEQSQAAGLRHQMSRLLELSRPYNVRAAHIYELLDETYWEPSDEARMGLVRLERDGKRGWRAGEQKLAYTAVKRFLHGEQLDANRAP